MPYNQGMKVAKDLMTAQPHSLATSDDIETTVKWFVDAGVMSAPVLSPSGEVVGVMTELALLRAYLRQHVQKDKKQKMAHFIDILSKPEFVKPADSLTEVIRAMIKSQTHRVLVVNGAGQLQGVISPKDIFRFLVGEEKETRNLGAELETAKATVQALSRELSDIKGILKRYEKMYEDSPTMMHSVDADGIIVMANKKIHQVLGYEPGGLLGKTIFDIYAKEDQDSAIQGLQSIRESGNISSAFSAMLTRVGSKIRVDLSSSALLDSNGHFIATITAARPVNSEDLLRALNDALQDHSIEEKDLAHLIQKFDS